ncbi:nucleotidyltransferase family protein [Vagococcus zengguangii]|uniref:Nucleotidyltransferase family protein n=1 Tax=Vagococcus zengguangii TaxID=2571750 RepID=A0A4D7CS54_9ENTE|nr:nucleotidyltransferase family protein [Vagococcus zengguangii]QCI87075.1 nucleotidyltransferase family protein [Vagococcus zengguangii]
MNKEDLAKLLWKQPTLREILTIVDRLELPDCWLCAGTIRNGVWDYLSGHLTPDLTMRDVDVVFYDPAISYEQTLLIEANLKQQHPTYQWELKNQVYMHQHNPNTPMYQNARDAIAKFPETCTAIGARLHPETKQLELYTPHGIEDLVSFIVRPTPYFAEDAERMSVYHARVKNKGWHDLWTNIQYKKAPN